MKGQDLFSLKIKKNRKKLSSAAVVIGALRVKINRIRTIFLVIQQLSVALNLHVVKYIISLESKVFSEIL